jgi:hypothetical protein
MTVDHSLVAELVAKQEITEEESRTFAERNVITRALGTRPGVDVDIRVEQTSPADIYLACSDGLCGFVEDEVIARTIAEAGGNLQAVAKNLIAAANAAGGEDNITVALARVDDTGTIEYQARNAATVADADGAAEAVADEVLAELATMAPPEKEEEDDTQKVPISDPPPAKAERKPPTPGGVRWLIWLIVLAAVTVFIFMGGTNLLVPANNERSTSPAVSPADSTSATPSLLFSAEDRALLEATVYVDNRPVGLAADFQHKGLKISPGPQHIKCILGSTTILDSTIDIQAGIQRVALTDAHKNLPLQ